VPLDGQLARRLVVVDGDVVRGGVADLAVEAVEDVAPVGRAFSISRQYTFTPPTSYAPRCPFPPS